MCPDGNNTKAPHFGGVLFFFPLIQLVLCGIVGWQINPDEHASWIWVVALFWVGMPHGAMDFHVITWVKHKVLGLRYDHQMITYTVLMALTYLGFTAAPVTFVLAFLVLTGLHFGEADRIHAMICHPNGDELPVTWGWLRGALVVGLPTLLAPEQSWSPFQMLSGVAFSPELATVLQVFGGSALSIGLLAAVWGTFKAPPAISSSTVKRFAAESVLCAAWFVLFPPMWAIGGYFLCIHATKHMLRLGNYQTPMGLNKKFLTELFRLHAQGWVLTLPALLAVWYWARELDAAWIPSLASASIGFYLISTLPHHLLVNRLPVRSGL